MLGVRTVVCACADGLSVIFLFKISANGPFGFIPSWWGSWPHCVDLGDGAAYRILHVIKKVSRGARFGMNDLL